jgi:hypothetical protein
VVGDRLCYKTVLSDALKLLSPSLPARFRGSCRLRRRPHLCLPRLRKSHDHERYGDPALAITDSTRNFGRPKRGPGKTLPGAKGSYSGRLVEIREIKGNLHGPTKFLGQNSEFSSVDSRIRP